MYMKLIQQKTMVEIQDIIDNETNLTGLVQKFVRDVIITDIPLAAHALGAFTPQLTIQLLSKLI